MNVQAIPLASVAIGDRLRAIDPAWVDLLAEEIARDGQKEAVRVVAQEGGFLLIDGARRIAALAKLGAATVEARVEPEEALADAAFVRLGEIKGNLMRAGLTVLDRAYHIAAWREVYEAAHTLRKRGRRPGAENGVRLRNNSIAGDGSPDEAFALRFSEAARRALKVSEDSIHRALIVARIDPAQGRRLTGHPCADNQSELLRLAELPPERQVRVIDLLTEAKAATVAEAIDRLDGRTPQAPLTPAELMTQRFARLSEAEQFAALDLMGDGIERWLAERAAKPRGPELRIVR